jgi:hypothetical protein
MIKSKEKKKLIGLKQKNVIVVETKITLFYSPNKTFWAKFSSLLLMFPPP